ncbi:hypothetical protein GFM44_23130 [Rhizobium leguminosarum bv. viciae]|nr:hypothetical protein [Rhizobium leguminosarum bv. viciae]
MENRTEATLALLGAGVLIFFGGEIFHPGEAARVQTIRDSSRQELAAKICPTYFEKGFVERHWSFSDMAWCEDYREKI